MIRANRKLRQSTQRKLLTLAVASCFATEMAYANPFGPTVINGQVFFNTRGNLLQITNTPGSIINWQGFSINTAEITRFIQQSSSSMVLNRVTGADPSVILGALQSNGRVILINPNGVTFGAGSMIDTAGMVASTLKLSDTDFLAGRLNFTDTPGAGSVINQGNITTTNGGFVYLVAPNIQNSGIIKSDGGEIILAAGKSVEIVNPNSPDVRVQIVAPDNQAVNLGQIIAQSGRIGIYGGLVRQGGTVSANSAVMGENGKIVFKATKDVTLDAGSSTTANGAQGGNITIQSDTGTTSVSGTVEAKGSEGTGGTVQLLGNRVGLFDNAKVDASGQSGGGTVLVGGDYQGKNPDIQNASQTYVGANATINADAISSGNGGKVIVWGNDTTQFYGSISARGGANSGNGGFIETSGHNFLDARGQVNTLAPFGTSGTWLLDPTNITIQTAGTDAVESSTAAGVTTFQDTVTPATASILTTGTLQTALLTNNVVVTTVSTATGVNGDITVANTITAPGTGNHNLTLSAENSIIINSGANINFAASTGNVSLLAGTASGNTTGTISTAGGVIQMGGGSVQLKAAAGIGTSGNPILTTGLANVAAQTGTGGVFLQNGTSGNINVTSVPNADVTVTVTGITTTTANNAGNISVNNQAATGTITVASPITTIGSATGASGGITLTTTGGNVVVNNSVTTGNSTTPDGTSAQSGAIVVTAGGTGAISGTGSLNTGSATVAAGAAADTATTGSITLNATKVSQTAGAAQTDKFVVSPGIASGATTTNLQGPLIATLTGGAGAAGGLFAAAPSALKLGAISTGGGDVGISAAGTITVGGNIAAGTGAVNITTTGATSNIDGGGGTISTTNTTTGLTLNAGGGVGIVTALNTNLGNTGNLNITTNANNAAGNVKVIEASALSTSQITTLSTAGTGTQTVDLTNSSGNFDFNSVTSFGSLADNLSITATTGNIVRSVIQGNSANDLTLYTPAGGIGQAPSAFGIFFDVAGHFTAHTGAAGAAGNISIGNTSAGGFKTSNLTLTTDGAGPHTIGLGYGNAGFTVDSALTSDPTYSYRVTPCIGCTTGTVTLSNNISASNLRINALNAITQTAGNLSITGNLGLRAGDDILINAVGSSNHVGGILAGIVTNSNKAFAYADTGAVTVGTVVMGAGTQLGADIAGISTSNGTITLSAGGTVAVTQNIAAGTGTVNITTTGGTSNIDGGGGTISSTNATTGITLNAGGGIGIGATVNTNVVGGGLFNLTTAGAGAAGNINMTEAGPLTFGNTTGNIDTTVAAGGGHSMVFTSTSGPFTVAADAGTCGNCVDNNLTMITSAGDILLKNTTAIDFGTGIVRLVSAGAITQTGTGAFSGSAVGARAANAIDLTGASNNFGTIAATTSNSGQAISYKSSGAVTVGSVAAVTGSFALTNGISTSGGDITLNTGGLITVSQPITTGGTTTGTVTFNPTAGVTATAASLTAANLLLTGAGPFTLTNTSNNVAKIAANVTGDVSYVDSNAVAVDTVGAVNGITTAGGNVVVAASGTGTLNVNQAINTVSGTAGANGGSVVLEAGGAITLQTSGTVNTSGAANTAGVGGIGGEIFIHHTNAAAADITLGKTVTAAGGSAAGGGTTGGKGAVVTVVNDNGGILVNAALDASGGATGSVAAGNGGTIQLKTAGTTAPITQTAAITATGATAGFLKVTSSDNVTLQTAGNDVGTLAATTTVSGKSFSYTDSNALTIGSVAASGTLVAPSTTSASQAVLSGIATTSGAVNVTATAGTLTIGQGITATGAGSTVSLTGTNVTNTATVRGDGGITVSATTANTGTINNTAGTFTNNGGATAISLTSDTLLLAGGTITGGSGAVNLTTKTATNGIGVEDNGQTFNVTNAMLNTIGTTGTITIGDAAHSGAISVARQAAITQGTKNITLVNTGGTNNIAITGNNDFTARNLTLNAGGAITQTTGTGKLITQNTGNLVLTATTGIGTLAAPVIIGTVAGNLSADNQTAATAGDVSLQTGTIIIGSGGTSILERSTGTIQINATNATTDTLTIGGNVSAPGVGGTIILNAGTAGSITRTGGTLTASTVQLGTTSAASVGATGTPIVTAATTLLDARSGAGDVWVSNTGAVNVRANATAGLVNVQNSGGTLSVATGGITSSNNGVTVNNTGNSITVGNVVTAGGTGVASLTSTGLTNTSTITGPGGVTIDAGTGTLTNTAGTITNGGGATATAVSLTADNMSLGGTIQGGAGIVTLQQKSNGQLINLGGADSGTTLGLTNTELNTISTTGVLRIGNATSGAISITAPVAPSQATTRLTSGAGISSTAATNTFSGTSLALVAAGAINVNTAVTNLEASTTTGGITVSNTAAGGLNVATVDGINTGVTSSGTAINLTETAGAVTLSNAVNAGASTVAVTLNGADKLLTNATTVTGTGGVTFTADNMALGTTPGNTISSGTGVVTLSTKDPLQIINVGVGATDSATVLGLTDTELNTIISTGGLTVGTTANTGGIVVVGNANPTGVTGSVGAFSLTTGGAITRTGGTLGTSGTAIDLSLNAHTGIGSLTGPAPIVIGAVTGSLSAINGPNAGGSGNIVLSTGAISLGGASAVIDEQISGGTISVTSSGNITIGGNLSVSGGGASTIILDANGSLTEVSAGAGTITAATLKFGTAATPTTTLIGTSAAPILIQAAAGATSSPSVTATATTGGIFLNQASGDLLTSSYHLTMPATAQSLELSTTGGKITVDGTVNGFGTGSVNTNLDNIALTAAGPTKNIDFTLGTAGNSLVGASVVATATGAITSDNVATTDVNVGTGALTLDSATGVGTNVLRVRTAAGTLAARTRTATNSIFVSEADSVTLATITTGATTVVNGAATTGVYDVTAAGTITTGTGGVNTANSGNTLLTTTGGTANSISLGTAVGNAGAANSTILTSTGNITGAGVVTGTNVTLDGATSVGATGAGNAINTAAGTITASSGSGGIFISEANAATLSTIGTSGVISIVNVAEGDLTSSGVISTSTASNVTITSTGQLILGTNVTSAGGVIALTANSNNTAAAENFQQTAGTVNANAGTVNVNVGTSAGTGQAQLRAITGNGGINVVTQGGSIVNDASGTSLLTSTGTVSLTAGGTASGVGATGAGNAINTAAGTITASSGSGGIFISEANAATLSTIGTSGVISIVNVAEGDLTSSGVISTSTASNVTITSTGQLILGTNVTSAGGVIALTANSNNTAAAENFQQTAGTVNANAGTVNVNVGTSAGTGQAQLRAITGNGGINVVTQGGSIVNDASGTSLLTSTGTVSLTAGGTASGVGATGAGNAINTAAGTITASSGSGGIFISEANAATLSTIGTSGVISIVNVAEGDLTSSGVISTSTASNVTITSTGQLILGTNVTSAGGVIALTANSNNTAAAENFQQTAGTVNANAGTVNVNVGTSAGTGQAQLRAITGNGGINVVTQGGSIVNDASGTSLLTSTGTVSLTAGGTASGVGATGAGNAINTAAGTITASSGSGGIFISEANAVTLSTIGTSGVISIVNVAEGDLTSSGVISTSTASNVTITSTGQLILGTNVTSAGGVIALTANSNNTAAAENFQQTAGTVNANAGTVNVNVGTSAGTGQAQLRAITGNGGINVVTQGGSIVNDASGTSLLTSTGTVSLTAGGTASGVGATGAGNAINTAAGTITASSGSGGIFISEADSANFTANTAGNGNIVLTSLNGVLNIAGNTGSTGSGNITLNSSVGGISLSANLSTGGGSVALNDAVTLKNSVSIDTTVGQATPTGNSITFSSTLDGTTAGAQNLTLNSGSTGTLTFTGNVGATAGTSRLGAVQITNAGDVDIDNLFTAASLVQLAGTGTTTISNPVNTNASAGVKLTTVDISIDGSGITTTGGGVVTFTNTGSLSLGSNISADGAVTQSGGGTVKIAGTGTRTITTTADNVSFADPVTLNTPLSITTNGTAPLTGDITFGSTLGSQILLGVSTLQGLTLTAGASDITFTGLVGGVAGAARLGAIQINSARNMTESAGMFTASLVQAGPGTGLTTLTGAVNTNTATGVQLSTVNITETGGITTTGAGVVNFTNTGALAINGDINAAGAITQSGGGTVSVGGAGTRSISSGGSQSYADAVTLGSDAVLTSTGNQPITFSSTVDGAANLTVTTAGLTTFAVPVGGGTPLTSLTTNGGGTTAINGGSVTTTSGQTFSDAVTYPVSTIFNAGTGTLTFGSTVTPTVAGLTLNLTADEMVFSGGAASIKANNGITLQTSTAAVTDIKVGSNAVTGTAASLDITTADIAALQAGFPLITIGRSTAPNFSVTVGNATFQDNLLIQSPSGVINVIGALNTAPGKNITLDTGASIGGGGTVATSLLTISRSGGIGTLVTPLHTNTLQLDAQNSGTGDVNIQNAGSVLLVNNFKNSAAGELRLTTTNGSIDTGSVAVQSAGGRIALIANDAGAGGNITVGSGGINSAGGIIALHAADTITINSGITTGGGAVEMIAGTGPGINTGHALFAPTNPPVATETADDIGAIQINAPINAGAGDIVLVTSANGTAGQVGGIAQSAGGPLLTSGTLTAVTLRGTGGSTGGGADITLNQATPVLNSTTNVNLFSCTYLGCPDSTPSVPPAPPVGPRSTPPFTTAPFINNIAAQPAGQYAFGSIVYISSTGTNIQGVGTANDFTFFNAGNFALSGIVLSARNLTFEASGNIGITLASGPITNNNITPGGTLKFMAGGNITYNQTATAFTIGTPTATFDRNLNFTAAGNIDLNSAIYIGTAGSLVLNANQTITQVPTNTAPPLPPNTSVNFGAPATTTGTVTLAGNNEVAVGGNLVINAQNLNVFGGVPAPAPSTASSAAIANQQKLGERLMVGGTIDINVPGTIVVQAGPANAVSDSAALINATTINIGQGSAGPPTSLALTAGTSNVTGTTSQNSDAKIVATGALNVSVGTGGLSLTGLSATTNSTSGVQATSIASLEGATMALNVLGDVTIQGGTANATGGTQAPGTFGADATAKIVSGGAFAPNIGGNLTISGGSSTASAGGRASAQGFLQAGLTLDLKVGKTLSIDNTLATATAGVGSTAISDAQLKALGNKTLTIGGDWIINGGTASAAGATSSATTVAGTDFGTATASTLHADVVGGISLLAGFETGGPTALSSAAMLAGGEMVINTGAAGVTIKGNTFPLSFPSAQPYLGLIQILPTDPPLRLNAGDGSHPPITINKIGGTSNIHFILDASRGFAIVLSGLPTNCGVGCDPTTDLLKRATEDQTSGVTTIVSNAKNSKGDLAKLCK